MKKHITIFTLLICSIVCFSQTSSIDFVIKNLGINVDGYFNTFTITTTFDSDNSLKSVSGEIEVKSIKTGITGRDEHLLEEDYFYISKHPKIYLKSTDVIKRTDDLYEAKVDLKIKGKMKQLSIPIEVEDTQESLRIISNFEINRKDFGVGGSSFVMSKTVKIKVFHVQNKQ